MFLLKKKNFFNNYLYFYFFLFKLKKKLSKIRLWQIKIAFFY